MKSLKLALLCGFLVWLVPFVVAFLLFPLRTSERPLFESIMPVVLTAMAVALSFFYFRKVQVPDPAREGLFLGVLWFLISVALDLLLFMEGPMKMAFVDYVKDIGLTYLILPFVTAGIGYATEKR